MAFIGIDFGGTNTKMGVVSEGELILSKSIQSQSEQSLSSKLDEIKLAILAIMAQLPDHSLEGIGMAFPSIVDSDAKKILSQYVKFTDASELDLAQWTTDNFNVPLAMENDARAALVGEWQYGTGRGHDNLVMCTLGTGFGSAALMSGRLIKGAHYVGSNLGGHMTIQFEGDVCNCGGIGCVETEGSSWVLEEKYRSTIINEASSLSNVQSLNFKDIFEQAELGDKVARNIRDHSVKAWSAAVINLVHAFDPAIVIIGGGVMHRKDEILPVIQSRVDDYTWPPAGTYQIRPARHFDIAGVLGMAYLAAQEHL